MVAYEKRLEVASEKKSRDFSFLEENLLHEFLSYDMCSSMLSLKVIRIREWHSTYSESTDQTMRQMVAYKGLKTIANYKTISTKSCHGAVAYERI